MSALSTPKVFLSPDLAGFLEDSVLGLDLLPVAMGLYDEVAPDPVVGGPAPVPIIDDGGGMIISTLTLFTYTCYCAGASPLAE